MKFNQWTLALASAGMVSLGSIAVADSHSVLSQVSKTTLSGYVDTSAIWALGSGGNGNFPGRTNDGVGRADGFNLNVVQVSLEKPLDESEWASGYKVDMWMGPDSQWLGNYSSGSFGANDFSLKQAYVALRAPIGNGLDLKMGVFDTVIGYEVANSPANPNFSRSYGFALEPFQHTGLLASYQLTDELSVSAGVANTTASISALLKTSSKEEQNSTSGASSFALVAPSFDTSHIKASAPRSRKFLTRFLPQYPHPNTATFISSFLAIYWKVQAWIASLIVSITVS